jgi:putative NADH-flavin reductase
MTDPKITKLAFEWYTGAVPTADQAQEHFRMLAQKEPTRAMEFGAALSMFLKHRQRLVDPVAAQSVYNEAASHHADGGESFRQRMKTYAVAAPWGDGGGEE